MATTFRPCSSQSTNSSRHSSNRSAATRGSQYLFGRLARTESAASRMCCGTNGYVISLWNQTSMVSPAFSTLEMACSELILRCEKRADPIREDLRLLDFWMMPGFLNDLEP